MASLAMNAWCIPTMAAAPPRRSLIVVARALPKCDKHQEPATKADGACAGGRRHAMILLAATATASVAVSHSARAGVSTLSGQYVDIEKMTPYVQDVGKWAVMEHNAQTGEKLQFGEVYKGQEQVVAGTNYKLDLTATGPSSSSRSYQAIVFDPLPNSNKSRQLTSFVPI